MQIDNAGTQKLQKATFKTRKNKMKTTKYTNWSYFIFEGFYESHLYNSDKLYEVNESGKDWDIDYPKFENEVCKSATELLEKYTKGKIISKMEFVKLDSPPYYNFRTDRLVLNIEYNEEELFTYLKENKDDFDAYLRANWTSYDGFVSFVANSYDEFMKDEKFVLNVALEYVILRKLYGKEWNPEKFRGIITDYHYDLWDAADEIFYNNLIPIKENSSSYDGEKNLNL